MGAEPAVAVRQPWRTLAITEEKLCAWLGRAMPGECIEYHRGHLLIDRSRRHGPFSEKDRRELSAIINRVLALAGEGRLCLAQKRLGEHDYSYRAVITRRDGAGRANAAAGRPACVGQGSAR